MLLEARWKEMRQKMQVIKDAYVSRHYTQCAKYGERLLAEVQGEIHPLHLAYLNFYTALSHDTLAREATLRSRQKSLSLAEKHYVAAIAALTPLDYSDRGLSSPASCSSSSHSSADTPIIWKFRRHGSVDSTASYASSATTCATPCSRPGLDYTHRSMGSYSFPSPPSHPHSRKRSLIVPSRPQTPEEYQFAADTAAFVRMLRTHLADVRTLTQGTNAPVVKFRSTGEVHGEVQSRAVASGALDGEERRKERRTRTWRPRFDPRETQRLCGEALAELGD
ncbi:hypothetical protein ACEQ8H_000782 [Pleosporales sp. CAS-2024a]